MNNFFKTFAADEDGAVTIDWVVLTAAILILGVTIGGFIISGSETMASNTETELSNAVVPTITF